MVSLNRRVKPLKPRLKTKSIVLSQTLSRDVSLHL